MKCDHTLPLFVDWIMLGCNVPYFLYTIYLYVGLMYKILPCNNSFGTVYCGAFSLFSLQYCILPRHPHGFKASWKMSAQQKGDFAEVKLSKYTRLTVGQLKCTSNFSRQITSAGAGISHALLSLPILSYTCLYFPTWFIMWMSCTLKSASRAWRTISCEISAPAEVICLEKL